MLTHDASRQRGRAEQTAFRDRMASFANLDFEADVGTKSTSWALVRTRVRTLIKLTTYAAIVSAFALLVLSTKGMIGSKSKAKPIEVTAVDAPWTPEPVDAKPWTPAPYTPVQLPNAATENAK